jgi:AraC family transcriptional regulator
MEILTQQGDLQKKKSNISVIKKSTRDEIHKRVLYAKDYIEGFYYKPDLSLDELGNISCMSKYHLLRCFKQVFGKTPYQYLKDIRFERAYSLLKTGKHSVAEVVVLCGYDDLSSFNKSFRKRFGINPENV